MISGVCVVNEVEAFAEDDIEPPPAFGTGIRTDYINGMAKRENDVTTETRTT